MIEPTMYFLLGALSAAILALAVIPVVAKRAARLERRRLARSAPLSLEEIRADKDQMRADFAVEIRRLESRVEELERINAEQLIAINRKREIIAELALDREDRVASAQELEEREHELRETIRRKEEEIARYARDLREAQRTLEMRTADLRQTENELAAAKAEIDGQKVALIANSTRLETVRDELTSLKMRMPDGAGEGAANSNAPEKDRPGEAVEVKLRDAEAERIAAETRITAMALRLEEQQEEHKGIVREKDNTIAQLTAEIETLRTELATMKSAGQSRDGGANGAGYEQLRESIRDIAAEITHMAARLEGGGSPIERMLEKRGEDRGSEADDIVVINGIADRVRALREASAKG